MKLQEQLSQPIETYVNNGYLKIRTKTIEDILAVDRYLDMKNRLINSIDFNSLQQLGQIGISEDPENKQEYETLLNNINKKFNEGDTTVEEEITKLYNKVSKFKKTESLQLYNKIISNLNQLHG
jgi:hypothetical protein